MSVDFQDLQSKVKVYKSYLWYGDQKRIQKETRLCRGYISLVLKGKKFNPNVIQIAREIAIQNARSIGVELQ